MRCASRRGPCFPKVQLLCLSPKLLVVIPSVCSTPTLPPKSSLLRNLRGSPSEARRPERGSGEKVPLSFFSL